jgi:hypothetical protein
MTHCKLLVSLLIFATAFTGSSAWSQTEARKGSSQETGDVYAGYSAVPNTFVLGVANGWNASLDIGTRRIAAALDFGQHFSSNSFGATSKTFTFMAGPRLWIPVGKASRTRPFADALSGGAFASTTNFASTQNFKSNA